MLNYATITQQINAVIQDDEDDNDRLPEHAPVQGTVTFTPNMKSGDAFKVTEDGVVVTVPVLKTVALIMDGRIMHEGEEGIPLFAAGPNSNPPTITYTASYSDLKAGGRQVELRDVVFEPKPGETLDLGRAVPVAGTRGVGVVEGPKGDKGDKGDRGVRGPKGDKGDKGDKGETGNPTSMVLTGTGFPEGVVTAPVGATYADTVMTAGAVRWVKTIDTGRSGWVVEYGDTRWRDVTANIPLPVLEGQLLVRRTTSIAYLYLYNLKVEHPGTFSGSEPYVDFGNFLPSGFYDPDIQWFYVGGLADRGAGYATGSVRVNRYGGLRITNVADGQYMTGLVSLSSSPARWPSTYPGTPA